MMLGVKALHTSHVLQMSWSPAPNAPCLCPGPLPQRDHLVPQASGFLLTDGETEAELLACVFASDLWSP